MKVIFAKLIVNARSKVHLRLYAARSWSSGPGGSISCCIHFKYFYFRRIVTVSGVVKSTTIALAMESAMGDVDVDVSYGWESGWQ